MLEQQDILEVTLERGQEVLLDIKDSARRRIIAGLRWDPADEATGMPHDLDILCIVFDKYGRFIQGVTGEEGYRTGDSGNIYHTGDVIDGEDSLDDEQISLELFNLSGKIHQIFFIAEVKNGVEFGKVNKPEIRLANAIDDRNFAHAHLGRGGAGEEDNAFIFGSIYRTPQGWAFKYVGDYFDDSDITDWAETLNMYLEIDEQALQDGGPPPIAEKGQSVPLHYSKEARQRIVCGLNWDPMESENCDLDLACVMYDADGQVVDGVSGKADETIDESGKVYHSGDDTSGQGDGVDDEAISVELRELPDYIHHVVFVAEVQSAHTFGDVINPAMRIADGKTDVDQLETRLNGQNGGGSDRNAYVFARITRGTNGWLLTLIDEYFDGHEIDDWIEYLKRYLG